MANYNFKDDILLGEQGENTILEDLITLGAILVSKNTTNTHDLIININGKKVTYECKTDVFDDTGNMFIETSSRGKLSGINVTRADWFVTYFKNLNEIWYIKTERLKEILAADVHPKIEQGGDINSRTEGFLLNKNAYRDDFVIRNSITHTPIIRKWQKKYKQS